MRIWRGNLQKVIHHHCSLDLHDLHHLHQPLDPIREELKNVPWQRRIGDVEQAENRAI
jgi:hypothetical protein